MGRAGVSGADSTEVRDMWSSSPARFDAKRRKLKWGNIRVKAKLLRGLSYAYQCSTYAFSTPYLSPPYISALRWRNLHHRADLIPIEGFNHECHPPLHDLYRDQCEPYLQPASCTLLHALQSRKPSSVPSAASLVSWRIFPFSLWVLLNRLISFSFWKKHLIPKTSSSSN